MSCCWRGEGRCCSSTTDEATRLWSSSNGVSWQEVDLPPSMGALGVRDAVFAHGRYEAMLDNKYAGGPNTAYGQSDAVWSSLNGQTWIHDTVAGTAGGVRFISVTPDRLSTRGRPSSRRSCRRMDFGQWRQLDEIKVTRGTYFNWFRVQERYTAPLHP